MPRGCNTLATSPAASLLRPLLPAVTLGGTQSANNLKKLLSCSHSRAIDLFIESIRARDAPGCSFIAYACSNYTAFMDARCTLCAESGGEACARMGFHAIDSFHGSDSSSSKKFYLNTNNRAPYCLYHYGWSLPTSLSLSLSLSRCRRSPLNSALSPHYALGVAVKFAKKPRNTARGGE